MYDPPRQEDLYVSSTREYFDDSFVEEYNKGFEEAKAGKPYKEPYEGGGHERDTTYRDRLNYYHYVGYFDYE